MEFRDFRDTVLTSWHILAAVNNNLESIPNKKTKKKKNPATAN